MKGKKGKNGRGVILPGMPRPSVADAVGYGRDSEKEKEKEREREEGRERGSRRESNRESDCENDDHMDEDRVRLRDRDAYGEDDRETDGKYKCL